MLLLDLSLFWEGPRAGLYPELLWWFPKIGVPTVATRINKQHTIGIK